MGLDVQWYSSKAKEEAIAEARKMNDALEKRVADLERIVRHLCPDKSDDV